MPEISCDATRSENELLRRLLGLPRAPELVADLATAIRLLAEVTHAATTYYEIAAVDSPELRFAQGHETTGQASAESTISRGVIARAIADRTSIVSASAREDKRFRELGSVRRYEIEAIACVPIEVGDLVGAICIQRCQQPGAFSEANVHLIEFFAQQLSLVAGRLIPDRPAAPVPLREHLRRVQETLVRDALSRNQGNVARAARELQVARSFVYSVVPNVELHRLPTRRRSA